jgi:hypothetical protein
VNGWLTWALVGIGLVYAVTEAAITAPVRRALAVLHPVVRTLLYCPACAGFWIGLGMGGFGPHPPAPLPAAAVPWASAVMLMGLAATWSAWKGGNPAYALEQERQDDDTTQAREARKQEQQREGGG